MKYRTVWISDTHLGSRGCRAEALSQFLKQLRCERLYLVGDIVDMWRLKNRWYWPGHHNDVIRRLLNHARHDCEVIFLPGNHDEAARHFHHVDFGGIRTLPYAIHVTADGRRLLVIHGDQFDMVVKHARLLSMFGGWAYEWLVTLNGPYNRLRAMMGLPYYSLSKTIKYKVKSACKFISKFEETLGDQARHRGLDGVVCGHIHKPEILEDTPQGVSYYNCGDWIENCSAIVEHHDGRIELLEHLDLPPQVPQCPEPSEASFGNSGENVLEKTSASAQRDNLFPGDDDFDWLNHQPDEEYEQSELTFGQR